MGIALGALHAWQPALGMGGAVVEQVDFVLGAKEKGWRPGGCWDTAGVLVSRAWVPKTELG